MPSSALTSLKGVTKTAIRGLIPLATRKRLSVWVSQLQWIDSSRRSWWSQELVRDLAETDADAFHRFLWSHHLGYAESYDVTRRFGSQSVKTSRTIFFADLREHVIESDVLGSHGVKSVFEAGCSLGYQLRFIETDLCPAATDLTGIDIDNYAISSGLKYLRSVGSRVSLQCGDMKDLERWLRGKQYDLILCTGVLMYLNEAAAGQAVATMLRHSRVLALAGLAHPRIDNARLEHSDVRSADNSFIHNFDRMVRDQSARIVWRRWEGDRDFDGNTVYFVFATNE